MHDTAQEVLLGEIGYITELLLMMLLFASYYFASEKKFDIHQKIMRVMVLLQTILVIYMVNSLLFTSYGHNFILHAIVGTVVYSLILYTFLLMEGKITIKLFILPERYQKTLMRLVMILWGVTIFFGAYSYLTIID